jgi:hypothetical protein
MEQAMTSIAPLEVREKFMTEPGLGAGNFLDHALAANPNRDVPYAFSHHRDHRGEVVLRGHSLVDLAAIRERYAKWYWANGVRPGEPVAVVIAEGLPPLLHFLALNSLGAVPTLVNDAMRPDVMVRYLDHVGPGSSRWPRRSRPVTCPVLTCRRSTRTGTGPTTWSRSSIPPARPARRSRRCWRTGSSGTASSRAWSGSPRSPTTG